MYASISPWSRPVATGVLMLVALLAGCASRPARDPVTVDQIVQMSRDGVIASDIIAKMEAADTVYRLSGSQLAHLKEQGVSDQVLDYMQDTYVDYERRRGGYRSYYYDPWWGYGFGPYPYWAWGYPRYGYYPYPHYRSRPPSSGSPPDHAKPSKPSNPPPYQRPSGARPDRFKQQRN